MDNTTTQHYYTNSSNLPNTNFTDKPTADHKALIGLGQDKNIRYPDRIRPPPLRGNDERIIGQEKNLILNAILRIINKWAFDLDFVPTQCRVR